ncbi:hypothetical protein [Pseudonocardia acaciae]|uniref:hypothetical protein n=1 Tax=Pseudonocardia acaciae TaxID=551276 RepID=UPI00049047B5|nr:hypothetical protein [Pseudonocardia acaciae]
MFSRLLIGIAVVLAPLVAAPSVAHAAQAPGKLASGATLWANQSVRSPGGRYFLTQQADGNLVFYRAPRTPVWSTKTGGNGVRTVMRKDGNLVVSTAADRTLFETHSSGAPGAWLSVSDDGDLKLYTPDRRVLWQPVTG